MRKAAAERRIMIKIAVDKITTNFLQFLLLMVYCHGHSLLLL